MTTYDSLQSYLCPPGNGVYTVHTAREKKDALHQRYYASADPSKVDTLWRERLSQFLNDPKQTNALLGICSDNGGGILRGANWGPLFIRETLKNHPLHDLGDIRVIPHLLHDKYLNETTLSTCRKSLYGTEKTAYAVSPLSIAEAVLTTLYQQKENFRLFALGGDHSVSYPLTKTYLKANREAGKRVALLHFDAHTDLLAQRLGIDLCFGSWTYHILPFLTQPSDLIQWGIRASGHDQSHWENTFGIQQHWAHTIRKEGIETLCEKTADYLTHEKIDALYITFDIDAISAEYVSATGTPEPNGLRPEEALYAISFFQKHFPITGADLVEVAPFVNQGTHQEPDSTLRVARDIAHALSHALAN